MVATAGVAEEGEAAMEGRPEVCEEVEGATTTEVAEGATTTEDTMEGEAGDKCGAEIAEVMEEGAMGEAVMEVVVTMATAAVATEDGNSCQWSSMTDELFLDCCKMWRMIAMRDTVQIEYNYCICGPNSFCLQLQTSEYRCFYYFSQIFPSV